jgi:SAM-dependent methyltransferase
MDFYDETFFKNRKDKTLIAASTVVPRIIEIFNPKSVIDFGCGAGEWLSAFISNGVNEVCGIDGEYVNIDSLIIHKSNFIPHDLNMPITTKKFDIALCLEVAEHLNPLSSDLIVETLIKSSDNIVFSAAIPGQGGVGHINEQPHSFWADKFIQYGYHVSDKLRLILIEDKTIPFWYRQNMLIFTKNRSLGLVGELDFSILEGDSYDHFS